ncbi:hypothetical protein TCDM_10708 [Trypanosoma cruzi Dm28c]|uniref:CCR4-NOT transcription complex subunit 11 n=2 Tax=Trypanosoma cruzi TaxID=5693 RepID=V5BBD7_TRYCR|nr:hypothetical protein TCDM_10708 [Trypanosoma cruzi Dm28c]KAF8275337.1 CCR4-NOT transcription complex subunit 11 [Trypanosoma cruzi]PBJ69461.1 hypothetical protein BCY84_19753 [Trypanosoma cruzi cruzi]PBJ70931.1 hypothetical protein BCY84_17777 [Trypanosoma cruzi cruzi]PWU84533.1 hypothetical protein C4B63_220g9 [Trypanosoma cruzi]
MVIEYLNSADTQRLIEFLGDGKLKFSVLEKSFKEAFPKDTHFNVSRAIQQLVQSMIKSGEGVGIVSSFFTLDIMCKMECETAKCVFYDALLELERVMRQDVCFTEQIKYASKETKEGKKSLEAINAEKYRFHCAAKGFAFRLLANKVSPDETSLAVLYDKQEQIDAALNAWEINSLQLKESIANIAHCWTQDVEKNSCEALSKNSAIFDSGVRAALLLQAARPQLPSLPLVSGELQFLTPGGSPGSDLLFFDTEPVTEEWKLSKKLIALSCNSLLNKEEQQQLIHTLSSGDLFHRLGINIELLSLMAIHNPDLSAALILKLPPQEGSQCIQQILKSSVPPEHAETVLLHASKILQQVNIRAYINGKLHLFKEKSTLSTSDKNSIKSFIMTLYQLVTKASKENKEVYIAETLKSEITQLCERCDLPEVSARWEELK